LVQKIGQVSKEVSMVAFRFIDNGKLHVGFNTKETLSEWLLREIAFWEERQSSEKTDGIREVQRDNEGVDSSATQRDQGKTRSGEVEEAEAS
jgi:hypothetical protein